MAEPIAVRCASSASHAILDFAQGSGSKKRWTITSRGSMTLRCGSTVGLGDSIAFDLVIRNGTVATAVDIWQGDIGVAEGRVSALGRRLAPGNREIEAAGKLVLPGGVDSHCHIAQRTSQGLVTADDFESGTISAAFGGTTTIIPFAAQHRGQSLRAVVDDYHRHADNKAIVDYAFHVIVSDPSEQVLKDEMPALVRDGYSSFKIYMAYDALRLNDRQILDVLSVARGERAMVMVHAESHELIGWLTDRMIAEGRTAPKHHAHARPPVSEREAAHRAITFAEVVDVPILIVHVSTRAATEQIRAAQDRGLAIYAETCPQYLFLTADDLDHPGFEGAKYCCTPPPRDRDSQAALWQGLRNGTFQVFSSDHSAFRFNDAKGKLAYGPNVTFNGFRRAFQGWRSGFPYYSRRVSERGGSASTSL